MKNNNEATAYLAGALREMTTHLLCHHYHRDGKLSLEKIMFDHAHIIAHTMHLQGNPLVHFPDPPVLSHSTPGEPA